MKTIVKIILLCLFVFASSAFAQEAQKIEEFGFIQCDEWKSKFDTLFLALKSPNAKVYVIYYGTQYYPIYKNGKLRNGN